VPVRLKGIAIERSRRFGDVYLVLALWRGIGLEELCERCFRSARNALRGRRRQLCWWRRGSASIGSPFSCCSAKYVYSPSNLQRTEALHRRFCKLAATIAPDLRMPVVLRARWHDVSPMSK
jgi:hypothetical protein